MTTNVPVNHQHRHIEEASPWALLLIPVAFGLVIFYLFVVIPKTLEPTYVRFKQLPCSAFVKPVPKGCHR